MTQTRHSRAQSLALIVFFSLVGWMLILPAAWWAVRYLVWAS